MTEEEDIKKIEEDLRQQRLLEEQEVKMKENDDSRRRTMIIRNFVEYFDREPTDEEMEESINFIERVMPKLKAKGLLDEKGGLKEDGRKQVIIDID